jgi:hypothetical protein
MTTTKTFYLTEVAEKFDSYGATRLCITDEKTGRVKTTVDATCFLDAKQKLGFDLTPIQSDLFE